MQAHEVGTLVAAYDAIGHELLSFLIFGHLAVVADESLGVQVGTHASLGHDDGDGLGIVGVVGLNGHVVDFRAYAECSVGGQRPRCGRPCHEVRLAPASPFLTRIYGLEECGHRRILHVAIATRQVQLVTRESCTGSWAIGLDGVALVEHILLVELLQEPPKGFDVFVIIGDVGVVEVDEVAHALGEVAPFLREHHHVLAALAVVLLRRDVARRLVVVDVGLGDAQRLLDAKLHGQSVRVPASLTMHLIAFHSLVAVESVFQRATQYMMDARMSVGGGRTLEEYELRTALSFCDTAVEDVFLLPLLKHLPVCLGQVHRFVFGESFSHCFLIVFYVIFGSCS